MSYKVLGCLLRVHRRTVTLRIVLDELLRLGRLPGVQLRIHVLADRPTREVITLLEEYRLKLYKIVLAGFPLLSFKHGELFMQSSNAQLDDFEKVQPDWYMIQDDDNWFEPHHITTELPFILNSNTVDLWYAHTLFFWDQPTKIHAERPHHSPKIFRALKGDRFPLNRIIHATERIHDQSIVTGRIATMKTPVLDYGCYSSEERQKVYSAYIEAGKVDPFVGGLTAPARLLDFPAGAISAGFMPDSEWIDLWTKHGSP